MNPDILQLFTDHVRHVLSTSIDVSYERREQQVSPVIVFLCLSMEKGSIAAEVLGQSGIDTELIADTLPEPLDGEPSSFLPVFSEETKTMLEKAAVIAMRAGHAHIGTEHLLLALIQMKHPDIERCFILNDIPTSSILSQLDHIFSSTSRLSHIQNIIEQRNAQSSSPSESPTPMSNNTLHQQRTHSHDQSTPSALDYFAKELTADDVVGELDPVIGRDREIDRLVHILSRRTKNNPVLVGEPGVGKTAIVEGLAKRICEGRVPDILLHKKIYSLDLSSLLAGSMYRGEFESRIKQVIDEVRSNRDIILFIDEVHMLVGAGGVQGSNMDAANILKPALAKGEIRCIGATTREEYRKYIEHDSALERRFQPISVNEPTEQEAYAIIKGLKQYYERFHKVEYTDEALRAAVRLSIRFMHDKQLPDKAIDLLDEAGAKARVLQNLPQEVKVYESLHRKLAKVMRKKDEAVLNEEFDAAVKFKNQEEALEKKLEEALTNVEGIDIPHIVIDEKQIAEVIAQMKGIPVDHILSSGNQKLSDLEGILNKEIVGQPEAVHEMVATLKRSAVGLSNQQRPMGTFLYLGPSGVGKTLLAKKIALHHFGDEDALVRMDMSEFSEGFTVSKLLGAPAGYIGHNDTVKLTDHIRKRPYSVVLFDEIEKAHPDIFNVLLQILDEGHVTDSTGRELNFRNCIIILTSNVGHHAFTRQAALGFSEEATREEVQREVVNAAIQEELEEMFPREFLNRIDHQIVFNNLSETAMRQIVALEFQELKKRLAAQHIQASLSSQAKRVIAEHSFSPETGARSVQQTMMRLIEEPIADAILRAREVKKAIPSRVLISTNTKGEITVKAT